MLHERVTLLKATACQTRVRAKKCWLAMCCELTSQAWANQVQGSSPLSILWKFHIMETRVLLQGGANKWSTPKGQNQPLKL